MATQTSLEKMLSVLDLIEASGGHLTSDDMLDRLGLTRSTLYRYLKILSESGFVTSFPKLGYTFGPRIAELDYKMRNSDPLIIASRPVMAELVHTTPGIALLCRIYRDKVLCVYQAFGTASFSSTYERGLARPMPRGAASRIILAHLRGRTITRLYNADPKGFSEGGLGNSLAEAKARLKEIRQRGWDVTESQVTRGVTGVAAPIFDVRENVLGSLSLTVGHTRLPAQEIRSIAERVSFCARIVTKAVSGEKPEELGPGLELVHN